MGDATRLGTVQILSRNGKVSSHRRGKSAFDRTIRNRVRSWFSQTTKGDEHVLMIRDTNQSSDEGVYSCQVNDSFGNLHAKFYIHMKLFLRPNFNLDISSQF